jgi:hypothetical protein
MGVGVVKPAQQELYNLSHTSSPVLLLVIGSCAFCPGLALDLDPPAHATYIAGTTDMHTCLLG